MPKLLLWERIQSLFRVFLSHVQLKFSSRAVPLVSLQSWQTVQSWSAVRVALMQLLATMMLMRPLTTAHVSKQTNVEFVVVQV